MRSHSGSPPRGRGNASSIASANSSSNSRVGGYNSRPLHSAAASAARQQQQQQSHHPIPRGGSGRPPLSLPPIIQGISSGASSLASSPSWAASSTRRTGGASSGLTLGLGTMTASSSASSLSRTSHVKTFAISFHVLLAKNFFSRWAHLAASPPPPKPVRPLRAEAACLLRGGGCKG